MVWTLQELYSNHTYRFRLFWNSCCNDFRLDAFRRNLLSWVLRIQLCSSSVSFNCFCVYVLKLFEYVRCQFLILKFKLFQTLCLCIIFVVRSNVLFCDDSSPYLWVAVCWVSLLWSQHVLLWPLGVAIANKFGRDRLDDDYLCTRCVVVFRVCDPGIIFVPMFFYSLWMDIIGFSQWSIWIAINVFSFMHMRRFRVVSLWSICFWCRSRFGLVGYSNRWGCSTSRVFDILCLCFASRWRLWSCEHIRWLFSRMLSDSERTKVRSSSVATRTRVVFIRTDIVG